MTKEGMLAALPDLEALKNANGVNYVADGYNTDGDRAVLWSYGNYTYEIECKPMKILLEHTSYEDAMEKFKAYLEG